jgi:hypothetical protein
MLVRTGMSPMALSSDADDICWQHLFDGRLSLVYHSRYRFCYTSGHRVAL